MHQFGMELHGIDLSALSGPGPDLEAILAAIASYGVVVMRGQVINEDEQLRVAALFGPLLAARSRAMTRKPEVRYETDAGDDDAAGRRVFFNEQWHADLSWADVDPPVTMLAAEAVECGCAGTQFANMRLAYAALDETTRSRIHGWKALHHVEMSRWIRHGAPRSRQPGWPRALARRVRALTRHVRTAMPAASRGMQVRLPRVPPWPGIAVPIVQVDPESGDRFIRLGDHAWTVQGMDDSAGANAVMELDRMAVEAAPIMRHEWRPGDVVMFDNRILLHRREPGLHAGSRRLRRVVVWPRRPRAWQAKRPGGPQ
jgi:alpha-ketoglutarate-dependent taurine dioxygenase